MSRPLALALGAWLLAAAAASEEAPPPAASRPPCLERPAVVVYLHQLQDRLMDRWVVPDDSPSDQAVVVRLRLAEDGTIPAYEVVSWTSRRAANAVELAFADVGSLGAIPEEASCLVGRSIQMKFENPY